MRSLLFGALVLLVGCSSNEGPGTSPDASVDAVVDAAALPPTPDAAALPPTPDAATPDAATPDAAALPPTPDAATPDAATPDAAALPPALGHLSPEALFALLPQHGFQLIDVHTPYAGELPGTDAHIVYTDTEGLVAYIGADLNAPVVLTCLSDHMSVIAGNALVGLGYTHISSLDGGMRAWEAAGYPLEHNP